MYTTDKDIGKLITAMENILPKHQVNEMTSQDRPVESKNLLENLF